MKLIKANQVFIPGGYPKNSLVTRLTNDGRSFSDLLKRYLDEAGKFVSIAGPSKAGKTVLVESTFGIDNLISISGARVETAPELWSRVLDWMEIPDEINKSQTNTSDSSQELDLSAEGGLPLVAKASGGVKLSAGSELSSQNSNTLKRKGLEQVVKEIGNSGYIVLLDDFHYIRSDVQKDVMRQIKEAARLGVKICVASVLHRADAAIRANTELQGRLTTLDIGYWSLAELKSIAVQGFAELNAELDPDAISKFAIEAAGSPQLMQTICLNACYELNIERAFDKKTEISISSDLMKKIFRASSRSMDFRTLVDILEGGPKQRGKERKLYKLKDGTVGDVYRCILKALASDPAQLSFSYDEIRKRATSLCEDDHPEGSSIIGSCRHMVSLAETQNRIDVSIDWNEERLLMDIPDPYFLFYLRWSDRLDEPNE